MDHWTRVRGTEYFIQNGEFLIQKEGDGHSYITMYTVCSISIYVWWPRLNMELDLQSLFGLLCTAVLIGWDPSTPPLPTHLGLIYEGDIGQQR